MIIHVTREIKQIRLYEANGTEDSIKKFFQQQKIEDLVVSRPCDSNYLSPNCLEEHLSKLLKNAIPNEREIEVHVY